jgi:hypothetical protein
MSTNRLYVVHSTPSGVHRIVHREDTGASQVPFNRHLRLTMSGEVRPFPGQVIERFAFRLNLSDPPGLPGDPNYVEGRLADYAADAVAFFARAASNISALCFLTEVKLARIGIDGKYVSDPLIAEVNQAGGAGGGITNPLQVAHAITLETDGRGSTRRGRFYLPLPASGVGASDGLVPNPVRDNVLQSCQTFLQDLNNVPGLEGNAPRVTIASSKGYNTDVTGVRVGRVYDTIRSRRRSLDESYSAILAVG